MFSTLDSVVFMSALMMKRGLLPLNCIDLPDASTPHWLDVGDPPDVATQLLLYKVPLSNVSRSSAMRGLDTTHVPSNGV
jgi:hypothetical protein